MEENPALLFKHQSCSKCVCGVYVVREERSVWWWGGPCQREGHTEYSIKQSFKKARKCHIKTGHAFNSTHRGPPVAKT